MHHVTGVVDVQHHTIRRGGIAVHPLIDQSIGQPDRIADCRSVLQPREGGLRGQIRTRLGQVSAGELEGRIRPQRAEVVAILIAARDGEDAGADHVCDRVPARGLESRRSGMKRASRSAIPSRRSAWARSMTPPSDDRRPPSKAAVIFLRERLETGRWQVVSSGMAGVAALQSVAGSVSATKSYAASSA